MAKKKGKGKPKGYQSNQVSTNSQDSKGHDQMTSNLHKELKDSETGEILQDVADTKKDETASAVEVLAIASEGESATAEKPNITRELELQEQISKLKALYGVIKNFEVRNATRNEALQNSSKMEEQWLNTDKELGLEKKFLERDEEMVVKIVREILDERNRNIWIQEELQNLEQISRSLWQEENEKLKQLDDLELLKNNVGDIEFKGEQKIEMEAEEVKKLHGQISTMHQLEKILDDVIQVACERGALVEYSVGILKALRLEFEKGHTDTNTMLSECRGELQKEREMVDQLMMEFLYKDVAYHYGQIPGNMGQRKNGES